MITEYLLYGLLLGLTAGLSPGPMLLLVISQSLRYGAGEGIRTAFAPLLSDAPVIAVALGLSVFAASADLLLGLLSLGGATFIGWLALNNLRAPVLAPGDIDGPPRSLLRGALTNVLNPHPWLFWITVGVPLLVAGMERSPWLPAAFMALFYVCLVGCKCLVAVVVARSGHWLSGRGYHRLMRVLGLLLLAIAVRLALQGIDWLAAV